MKTERDRCIALAGVFQAAGLASQVARTGMGEATAMETSIHSLFKVNADSVEDIFNGIKGLSFGLQTMLDQLEEGEKGRNIEVTRYAIALLHLERKLSKQASMLQRIGDEIGLATERLEYFPMLHSNILAQLAETYAGTISTLQPRIMIQGEPLHLQNPENVNKIRALLLAGIRSAMLWRQCGGSRLKMLFHRKTSARLAEELIREIKASEMLH
ncbi:high frequency lysogenization protein HflD [Solemya velesiana gill symbiont]|uniref:High frequency lysogenization protein HflD homolog n=1 Tax=Solemya velesiana gill symbiont TaxID=1918948 RepID=A0A1T2KSK9_9GAMM|nr:high frequency lysogenization protein HflD [Solemya velesiana gill symbiont]OOZ35686.1 lysogenization regulator HflD [Solemya velesiana gill symbiont]